MPKPVRSAHASRPPVARRTGTGDSPGAARTPAWADQRLLGTLIVLLTVACFSPAVTAEFTNWDDPDTIAQNPRLNPPTVRGWLSFWDPRHPYMDLYVPVTYTAWSALAAVAYVPEPDPEGIRLNPWVFHGANVAVHAMSALAAFALLRRLVKSAPAAAAGALLFALHPVQVEPVAWASGTKDVLWGMFALVSVWQYVAYAQAHTEGGASPSSDAARRRAGWHYTAATVALVLAMLAKPTAVVVPAVVAVLDLLVLRRPLPKVALSVLPWVVLAVPVVIEANYAQPAHDKDALAQRVPVALRPLIAADALAFYLRKLVFPLHLGPLYDRAPMTVLANKWHLWTWVAPAALTGIAVSLLRKAPWAAAALAVFVLGVAPVAGLVPFDFQAFSTVADHYLYLSMLGPAMALAFALDQVWRRAPAPERTTVAPRPGGATGPAVAAGVAVVLVVLGARSFMQASHWQDSIALFNHAARVNPRSAAAFTQLGMALEARQRLGEAVTAYEAAAQARPDLPEMRANLAGILARTGELDRAEALYREVLASHPDLPVARLGLAELERVRSRHPGTRATRPAGG